MKKLYRAISSSELWIGSVLLLSVSLLLGAGCAKGPQGHTMALGSAPATPAAEMYHINSINSALAAAVLQPPEGSADYHLAPEDLLEITLFNIPEADARLTPRKMEARVSQEGTVTLPLLGDVPASGLTISDLEQTLRQRYDRYLHHPQVGVQIKEYHGQRISVLGAVRNPGVFQLTGPKTLVDLLSMSGGISERAGTQVYIYRKTPEGRKSYIVDLLALARTPGLVNMPVQAGDVINVPAAGMFFVDGAVGKPGSYPLVQPYTLTQALAVAGGVTRTLADYGGITIFRRRDGTEAEKIPVDLSDILAGTARDPQVEAEDVIVVPISTAKYIVERFLGTIGLPATPAIR